VRQSFHIVFQSSFPVLGNHLLTSCFLGEWGSCHPRFIGIIKVLLRILVLLQSGQRFCHLVMGQGV
jgi:hypothetical protein